LGERKFNAGEPTTRSAIYSNGITVQIGEAVEEQVEAKAAVPWLQHSTYDYDNQQTTPLAGFPGAPNDLFSNGLTNGLSVKDHQSMEVDGDGDTGFSLEQMLNVSKAADIWQVTLCVFSFVQLCYFQLLLDMEGGT
jgi:hypothetical protein